MLYLVGFPVGIAALVLAVRLVDPPSTPSSEPPTAFAFIYLTLGLPAAVLGVLHQVVLWSVPRRWSLGQFRLLALLSALLIFDVVPTVLFDENFTAWRAHLPLVVGALAYGAAVRPLRLEMPPSPRSVA
jgi:hypothetical protein